MNDDHVPAASCREDGGEATSCVRDRMWNAGFFSRVVSLDRYPIGKLQPGGRKKKVGKRGLHEAHRNEAHSQSELATEQK